MGDSSAESLPLDCDPNEDSATKFFTTHWPGGEHIAPQLAQEKLQAFAVHNPSMAHWSVTETLASYPGRVAPLPDPESVEAATVEAGLFITPKTIHRLVEWNADEEFQYDWDHVYPSWEQGPVTEHRWIEALLDAYDIDMPSNLEEAPVDRVMFDLLCEYLRTMAPKLMNAADDPLELTEQVHAYMAAIQEQ